MEVRKQLCFAQKVIHSGELQCDNMMEVNEGGEGMKEGGGMVDELEEFAMVDVSQWLLIAYKNIRQKSMMNWLPNTYGYVMLYIHRLQLVFYQNDKTLYIEFKF